MLRIEKLFLQGFKSFSDPTELVFDEKGITAVVGPNGCGKSNIADAMSWVIGEQRAKALRGGKMEDVIFQGSRNRPQSGMAEVLLTMVVHETFEVRGEANQPETQALLKVEESLERAEAAVEPPAPPDSPADLQIDNANLVEEIASGSAIADIVIESDKAPQHTLKKRRRYSPQGVTRVFREGERVTVARRLFRTGESEYEMNGCSCRLREIQDLFAGTGLGGAHYAIIEQGRIGQVLSAKPLDRRALIEEAAGISKFKMRQHSAELKLDAAKQNLSRVTDILIEIERQQNSLKRQAARARRYRRLKQEMRDLMRAVYVVDYRTTAGAITDLDAFLSEVSSRENEILSNVAQLEQSQVEATQTARASEDSLNEARQVAASVDLDAERARQQHSHLSDQLQTLGVRSEQFAKDQAIIDERRRIIDREIFRLREELKNLEEGIDNDSRILIEAENEHRARLVSDEESERTLEGAHKKVYECVTQLELWRQLKRQFTDSVDRSRLRLDGLGLERERASTQARSAQEQQAQLSANLEETSALQHHVGSELDDLAGMLFETSRSREVSQNELSTLLRDSTAAEQRLKSLNELNQRRAQFSEAVQALMTRDPQLNGFKTLGTLADFVQVSPELEPMIETALREELQFVVVPTFDDALSAIEFLKIEGAGRATFLVVGLHGAEPDDPEMSLNPGFDPEKHFVTPLVNDNDADGHDLKRYQTLESMLGLRTEFRDAFKLALPGLAGARVVEDAAQAIRCEGGNWSATGNGSGNNLTTLSITGERVVSGRLISGGSRSEKGVGVLALKREVGELTAGLESLTVTAAVAEAGLNQIKSRITGLEETQRQRDAELRQIEKKLAVLREQLLQCEREIERARTHIYVVEQEISQAETELQEFESKLQHADSQTQEAEADRAAADKIVETAQVEIVELRRNAEQRSQELSRRRAEFAGKTERRRGLQNDIRRLENEANDLADRLGRSRLEAVEADDQSSNTQATIHNIAGQLQTLLVQQQLRASELEQRAAYLAGARERLEAIEIELRAAREAATQAREKRAQKEIEKARLTSDLDHLIHSCHTELGENIVEVSQRLENNSQVDATNSESGADQSSLPSRQFDNLDDDSEPAEDKDEDKDEVLFWTVPEDFDLETAKARLDELRAKIEGLGPVNMMALEELTEIEERFIFLSAQKNDIEKAIADTQSAIAEIKRRSRERFQNAFHYINENFKRMFQELFGGGHGEMRLIDESDILESGIEIIAQPPGKRLQNVLLLSGGEKAMAALSLVLAIFKFRPSPFCLLDEVDAPLDEVNIGRFADKVIEMSSDTQFMIITHSKRTMEAAQTLYGVTMEDPGVSKLISVKLT